MKFHRWFFRFFVIFVSWSSTCFAHFGLPPTEIHESIGKSDLVLIGTVIDSSAIIDSVTLNFLADLHTIRVHQVLYGKEKILRAIFSQSSLDMVNSSVKKNKQAKNVKISAVWYHDVPSSDSISKQRNQSAKRIVMWSSGMGGPCYLTHTPQLFFFKVSKFPASIPNGALVCDSNVKKYESISQIPTISDLKEKFYFEATTGTIDSTWNVTQKPEKKWISIVAALGPVMSITNQAKKKQRLQELLNHDDAMLAGNAWAALRKIEQDRKVKKRPAEPEQNE